MSSIYPNPSIDYTTVEIYLNDEILNAELIVYNVLGSEIQKQNVSNMDVLTLDTRSYTNGIYLFVLKTSNGMVEKKKVIISK
ncbi:MAG: T9SS type A sorting domain-containing protein [Bacteroidetes bacterium]|nr:T9SS type A sorting domain-containing protein [Bacteroidota bacterium]